MFAPIQEILEFLDEHPRSVAATLLGVILVGSVGGTLLLLVQKSQVDDKNKLLEQREKLYSEQLELQETRHRQALGLAALESTSIGQELEQLRAGIVKISAVASESKTAVKQVLDSGKLDSAAQKTLTATIESLEAQRQEVERTLERAKAVADLAEKMRKVPVTISQRPSMPLLLLTSEWGTLTAMFWPIVGIVVVILWLQNRRLRRRLKAVEGDT